MTGGYRQMPPQVDLPALEHEVLARWRRPRRLHPLAGPDRRRPASGPSTKARRPPTAAGDPPRRGPGLQGPVPALQDDAGPPRVPRRAGWDCHGLPVELEVEKELGFTGKRDIEAYGIAEFNAKCRESVLEHVDEFTRMTERMGYWVDFDAPTGRWTPRYVESVWWSLKQIFDKGLLVQDYRVAPYCPRCGTGLSDHEVAQGYQT